MSGADAIKSSKGVGDEWGTPFDLFGDIQVEYLAGQKVFDPCPNLSRRIPGTMWTPEPSDGLHIEWDRRLSIFVNSPFSDIAPWVFKASVSQCFVVMLLPVRSDQAWWHAYGRQARIVFIQGRVNYVNPAVEKSAGASFPSCLWIFGSVPAVEFWRPPCHVRTRKAHP